MKGRRGRAPARAGGSPWMPQALLLLVLLIAVPLVWYNFSRFFTTHSARPVSAPEQSWHETLMVQENESERCKNSQICWHSGCGPDGLGCVMTDAARREKIVSAIKWSWDGYRAHAWGADTLLPFQKAGEQWMRLGLTIVDSLDTLLLAGLQEEFRQGRDWVERQLDVENATAVSVFETTIRVLGGLLSAYHLSPGGPDPLFRDKALLLAERLLPAFKTPHRLAMPYLDLAWGAAPEHKPEWMKIREGTTTLADAGTLALEFTSVSLLSGKPQYGAAATQLWHLLDSRRAHAAPQGLFCNAMFIHSLTCASGEKGVGGCADSAYEYMLKQWILSGKRDKLALKLYKRAMRAVREELLDEAETRVGRLTYVGVVDNTKGFLPVMEHLACFLPGLLALGHYHGINTAVHKHDDDDLTLAKKLMRTCNELYRQSVTGLAPEAALIAPHTLSSYGRRARPVRSSLATWDQGLMGATPLLGRREGLGSGSAGGVSYEAEMRAAVPDMADMDVVDLLLLHKWWRRSRGTNVSAEQLQAMVAGGQLGWMSVEHQRSMMEALKRPLSGEGVYWTHKHDILLRPETVESLYILYRVSGDPKYKHWGWQIYRAFHQHCNVSTGGFASLERGDMLPPWRRHGATMPSFWIAETLKYLYLLFDEVASAKLSLDKWVFNTEAHPLPVHHRAWQEGLGMAVLV